MEQKDADAVLAVAVELALARGSRMVEPAAGEHAAAERGIDHDRWFAALVELRGRELVQLASADPSQVVLLALTNAGLVRYLEARRPDLAEVRRRVRDAAVAAAGRGPLSLAEDLGEPHLLVECLLDELVSQRRITYSKAPGRRFHVHRADSDVTERAVPPPGTR